MQDHKRVKIEGQRGRGRPSKQLQNNNNANTNTNSNNKLFNTSTSSSESSESSESSTEDEDNNATSKAPKKVKSTVQQPSTSFSSSPFPYLTGKLQNAASAAAAAAAEAKASGTNSSKSNPFTKKASGRVTEKVTAYSIWAKKMRPKVEKRNVGMGFADIGCRLNQMWLDVPKAEKAVWQAKAKRLWRKLEKKASSSVVIASKGQSNHHRGTVGGNRSILLAQPDDKASSVQMPPPKINSDSSSSGLYKVVGTGPLECAAHLKLLGESLSVIGERLTEHEGQIAVTGSLSVLLDSLLCASAPLLCLTQQIPELQDKDSQEKLSQALDNIAYIMPGL